MVEIFPGFWVFDFPDYQSHDSAVKLMFHCYVSHAADITTSLLTVKIERMWVKQCHKPPMTGNGLYHLVMVIWGMVYYSFNPVILFV